MANNGIKIYENKLSTLRSSYAMLCYAATTTGCLLLLLMLLLLFIHKLAVTNKLYQNHINLKCDKRLCVMPQVNNNKKEEEEANKERKKA